MTIDRNNISDKESAKGLDYNGKKLSSDEKKIFDDLVNPGLGLIRDIAEVLEKVKEAQDATKFERGVFNYLSEAKREKKEAVKAINDGNNKQFDSAFSRQLSLRPTPEKKDDNKGKKDKESLEKKIEELEVEVAGLDISIKEEQEFIDSIDSGDEDDKIEEKEEEIRILEDFKNLLEGTPVKEGRPLYQSPTAIDLQSARDELEEIANKYRDFADKDVFFWQVKNSGYGSKKGSSLFVGNKNLNIFNRRLIDILRKEIGSDEVKNALQNSTLSGKSRAIDLWEGKGSKKQSGDIGIIEKSSWKETKWSNDVTSFNAKTITYQEGVNEKGESHISAEKKKISELKDYPDGSGSEKAVWPYRILTDDEFFEFMKNAFPKNSYGRGSSTINSESNAMTNKLAGERLFTIGLLGFSKNPAEDLSGEKKKNKNFFIENVIKEKFPNTAGEQLTTEVYNLPLRSIIELFWDLYETDTLINNFKNSSSRRKLKEEVTKHEINFIKNIRSAGITKDIVSDEVLLDVAEPTMVYLDHLLKDGIAAPGLRARNGSRHDLSGKKEIKVDKSNITYGTSGNWRDFLDTTPLNKRISKLKAEKKRLKKRQGSSNRIIDNHFENQFELERSRKSKLREIELLKEELRLLKDGSIDDFKKKIRDTYKDGGKGNTRPEINQMMSFLKVLEEKEKQDQKTKGVPEVGIVDQDLKDIKSALDTLDANLEEHEKLTGQFVTYGKTGRERALNKKLGDSDIRKYKAAYEKIQELRALSEDEQDDLKALKGKADGTLKDDEPQAPELSESELKTAFGEIDGVATQKLADKWKNAGIKKEEIEKIIKEVTESSDRKKATKKFIDHLKGKGLDEGTIDTSNKSEDEIWKEFLKKDPERVVKTIYTCRLEDGDFKNSIKNEMKGKVKSENTDDEERLNMTEYGATEKDGEPDEKGMVEYLWQKAKGGSGLNYYKIKGESNGGDENGKEETGVLNHLKNNWHWYALGTLGVLVLLAVIFWKNISEWWNGPAEEEGKGAEDEEKEEEENE